ncbi:hypothetical protein K1T71_009464 [Dendrolimus kikuchii]|uniref:Uncharacterized protein n=1 Tax=Dendrolimus kikuchii TaxID=765133 RepID=A0ACC1CUK9_9NEOP|nr:hypothetical protein K1T71_009464 [Dendrolimus kikuchii]
MGFVQNANLVFKSNTKSGDYHDEMNNTNFKKWLTDKLLPNLEEPPLIIMDNAPYHSIRMNKTPTTNTNKPEIQKWLADNRLDFTSELTKPLDSLLAQHGHKCLRLPAYHCDLNPIEMVWSSMKRKVAVINIEHKNQNMQKLITEAFNSIDVSEWQKYCAHVNKIEEEYRRKDVYLDQPFVVHLDSDSDTDSDSDSDFEEISGIYPLDHTYGISAHTSAALDHNYCMKGFE